MKPNPAARAAIPASGLTAKRPTSADQLSVRVAMVFMMHRIEQIRCLERRRVSCLKIKGLRTLTGLKGSNCAEVSQQGVLKRHSASYLTSQLTCARERAT